MVDDTVHRLPEMGLLRLPKQEMVRLLPQQKLRGRMGFLYGTQTSWQETARVSFFKLWFPFRGSALFSFAGSLARWLAGSLALSSCAHLKLLNYTLSVSDRAPRQDSDTSIRPASLHITAATSQLAPWAEITGLTCETFSHDKCWSVTERWFIDGVNKLRDA